MSAEATVGDVEEALRLFKVRKSWNKLLTKMAMRMIIKITLKIKIWIVVITSMIVYTLSLPSFLFSHPLFPSLTFLLPSLSLSNSLSHTLLLLSSSLTLTSGVYSSSKSEQFQHARRGSDTGRSETGRRLSEKKNRNENDCKLEADNRWSDVSGMFMADVLICHNRLFIDPFSNLRTVTE